MVGGDELLDGVGVDVFSQVITTLIKLLEQYNGITGHLQIQIQIYRLCISTVQ